MKGMSTQERLDDICNISGLSESIVRRVLEAERQSIAKSLKKGERATLIGRCVIRPEIRSKVGIGVPPVQINYIKLTSQVSSSMEALLQDLTGFETDTEDYTEIPHTLTNQIPALQ